MNATGLAVRPVAVVEVAPTEDLDPTAPADARDEVHEALRRFAERPVEELRRSGLPRAARRARPAPVAPEPL